MGDSCETYPRSTKRPLLYLFYCDTTIRNIYRKPFRTQFNPRVPSILSLYAFSSSSGCTVFLVGFYGSFSRRGPCGLTRKM